MPYSAEFALGPKHPADLPNPRHSFSWRTASVALVCLALVACGGGSDSGSSSATTTRLVVFGDSLMDTGTFGFKNVTQGSASLGAGSNPVLTTALASRLNVAEPCPFFRSVDAGATFTNTAGCTNFAIGGGAVNLPATPTSPVRIPVQLNASVAAVSSYAPSDLVLIDAAGNDVANLIGAFLALQQGDPTAFVTLTGSILGAQTVSAQLAAAPTTAPAQLGFAYMAALATVLRSTIETTVLNRGAERVVVIGSVNVAVTPRLAIVLASLPAAARAQLTPLFSDWVNAFNLQLESGFVGNPRVLFVNGFQLFNRILSSPATFGLTNITDASCPPTGQGPAGPTYTLSACSEVVATGFIASATPSFITGQPLAGDWSTFLFSDNFHPTPRGYQAAADIIMESITARGWR